MCEPFKLIGCLALVLCPEDLIKQNSVMGGPGRTLDAGMRSQEEVPVSCLGNTAVDNGAALDVAVGREVFFRRGIEARLVTLHRHENGDPRLVLGRVLGSASSPDEWKLLIQDLSKLPFRHTVSEDDNVLWEIFAMLLVKFKTGFESLGQHLSEHLLLRRLFP